MQALSWGGDPGELVVVASHWGSGMGFMGDAELQSYRHELLIPGAPEELAAMLPPGRLRPSSAQYDAYVVACLRSVGAHLVHGTVEDLAPVGGSGSEISDSACVLRVSGKDGSTCLVEAETVVLATGSRPKPAPPEWAARGAVGYDEVYRMTADERAELCRDKRLVIVGAGNSGMQTAALVAGLGRDVVILASRYHGMFPVETEDRYAWRGQSGLTCELVAKSAMSCRDGLMSGICIRLLVYRELELVPGEVLRFRIGYLDDDNTMRLTRCSLPGRCEHAVAERAGEGWAEWREADTVVIWATGSEPVYPPSAALSALPREADGRIRVDEDGRTEWRSVYLTGASRGHRSVNEMTPAAAADRIVAVGATTVGAAGAVAPSGTSNPSNPRSTISTSSTSSTISTAGEPAREVR